MLSAAAVNKTFTSPDMIKWNGFQIIGETLLSVLQCQRYPYQFLKRDESVERAILETPDISEQVEILLTSTYVRIWMLNHMNTNLPRNGHTQSHSLLDLNGFPKHSIDDRKRDLLYYVWIE
jgi:hypothetical protein